MRPSKKSRVAAVLDTKAECLVVDDALNDTFFVRDRCSEDQNSSDLLDFGARFMHSTRQNPHNGAYDWSEKPEFEVRTSDTSFVLASAVRTISQTKLSERFRNAVTGRAKAARTILTFFVNDHPVITTPPPQPVRSVNELREPVGYIKARDTKSDIDTFCSEHVYVVDGEAMLVASRASELTEVSCYGNREKAGCGDTCARRQAFIRSQDMQHPLADKPHTLKVLAALKDIDNGGFKSGTPIGEKPVRVRSIRKR